MLSPGMRATAIPPAPPGLDELAPRPENRRTAGLRALRSESKWRDGGRAAAARFGPFSPPVPFAVRAFCCALLNGHKYFPGRLAAPERVGLSRSCPLPVPRHECDRQTQCPHPAAIFAWRSSQIPLSWLPLVGFGERVGPILPLISATIFDL